MKLIYLREVVADSYLDLHSLLCPTLHFLSYQTHFWCWYWYQNISLTNCPFCILCHLESDPCDDNSCIRDFCLVCCFSSQSSMCVIAAFLVPNLVNIVWKGKRSTFFSTAAQKHVWTASVVPAVKVLAEGMCLNGKCFGERESVSKRGGSTLAVSAHRC